MKSNYSNRLLNSNYLFYSTCNKNLRMMIILQVLPLRLRERALLSWIHTQCSNKSDETFACKRELFYYHHVYFQFKSLFNIKYKIPIIISFVEWKHRYGKKDILSNWYTQVQKFSPYDIFWIKQIHSMNVLGFHSKIQIMI